MPTEKERELLELLRENPQLSQNELAARLGITRSSLSVHITNLTRKGFIAGRGYVLRERPYAVVIGGANVDILGFSKAPLLAADSNPGRIKICLGGVGRNIAENLARLGRETSLIAPIGEDAFGRDMARQCGELGIDMSRCAGSAAGSSIYLAIMDDRGEMALALSDMSPSDAFPAGHLKKHAPFLQGAGVVVLDGNLPVEVVECAKEILAGRRILLDPVSAAKARRLRGRLSGLTAVKANRLEAEALTDIPVGRDTLERVADGLMAQGVEKVFLTLGAEGAYYQDETCSGLLPPLTDRVVNATGAGDAFAAGLAACLMDGLETGACARFALACAAIALRSGDTVSGEMSAQAAEKLLKESEATELGGN